MSGQTPQPNVELDLLSPDARAAALAETRITYIWHHTDATIVATSWKAERRHAITEQVGWQERTPRPALRVWVRVLDREPGTGRGRVVRVTDDELSHGYSLSADDALRREVERLERRRDIFLQRVKNLDVFLGVIATYKAAR